MKFHWLLSGKLKSLDDLVLNTGLKAQVQIAIQLYLLDARITEVKRAVQLRDFPLTISETAILGNAIKQVKSCNNADIVNVHKNLNQVSSVVKPLTKAFADELKKQVDHIKDVTVDCLVFFSFRCQVFVNKETNDQIGRWSNILRVYQNSFRVNTTSGIREVIQNGRQFMESELTFVPELCGDKRPCKECVVKEFHTLTHPSGKIRQMKHRYYEELKQN